MAAIRWPRRSPGNPNLPTTRRYQELLDRKDIDCIVAAVPDHWHMRVVVDACNAGKDIYCEKPMSHAAAQGFEMVEAAQKNSRIVQIGSQRVSSVLCAKARELYQAGAIGVVEMVELTLGRNSPTGAWEYPPPLDLSPANLDWDTWLNDAPKIPFDKYRFARWRCWKEYGTGVGGDLMVHLISGMLFTLGWNEAPRSARRWAASSAGRTAATCRTCTRCCSIITAPRYMCGWAWAPRRPNWRASWGRKAFWTPTGANCGTRRNSAWIPRPATTPAAFRRRCARSTSSSGRLNMKSRPAASR
jgi:predicted dehydrogenase